MQEKHTLSNKFSVEFHFTGTRLEAKWNPYTPHGAELRKIWPQYVAARTDFINCLSAMLGLDITIIDAA